MSLSSVQWPSFLGIGTPKSGTTWLYDLMKSHPEIWVPHKREIHFFNREYSRGISWYEQFFPRDNISAYEAIGEVTPHYLYCSPDQIKMLRSQVPSVRKLILVLRNPIDRLYSHYWFRRRVENAHLSFLTFIENRSNIVELGFYAKYLERWLEYFGREKILILTTEKDLSMVRKTRRKLASFLQVDPKLFPENAGMSKKNTRHLPRFRKAYAWAIAVRRAFRRADIHWPSRLAHALGVKDWFGKQKVEAEMDSGLREELAALYSNDVRKLERLLDREFPEWELASKEKP